MMDALASAIVDSAGWAKGDLAAVYFETEQGGVDRLRQPDATVAMVPLPFFLKHADELKLTARLSPVETGGDGTEVWSLVAKKGRVTSAASLENWQIVSVVGYAPQFIRGPALGSWGRLPASARIVMSGQVLSALRKAASGENIALVLDRSTVASLSTLPFGADLEVVTRSPSMPQGVLCTVTKRLAPDRWKGLATGLGKLRDLPSGASALLGVRLTGFAQLDEKSLSAARRAYERAGDEGR